MNNLFKPI